MSRLGTPIAVQIAAFLVRQKCETPVTGDLLSEQFSIPGETAGNVIGKNGTTIDAIKSQSGCMISIKDKSTEQPDQRLVMVRGSAAGIQLAKSLISQYTGLH